MTKRIDWIDGLRGIACLGVFVYHFLRYTFPATYDGNAENIKVFNSEVVCSNNPLAFIVNGNFYVCLFFLISAFVLSLQVIDKQNKKDIAVMLFKRYPRLALPVTIIGIISFVVGKLLLFVGFDAQIPAQSLNVIQLIKELLFDTWFIGSENVLSVFWMLSILFYGSFITIIIGLMISNIQEFKKQMVILLICSIFISLINFYYLSYAFGIFMAFIYVNKKKEIESMVNNKSATKTVIIVVLSVICIILSGYPSMLLYPSSDLAAFDSGIYKFLEILPANLYYKSHIFHILGAFLLFVIVLCSKSVQRFLSRKYFCFLVEFHSLYL